MKWGGEKLFVILLNKTRLTQAVPHYFNEHGSIAINEPRRASKHSESEFQPDGRYSGVKEISDIGFVQIGTTIPLEEEDSEQAGQP